MSIVLCRIFVAKRSRCRCQRQRCRSTHRRLRKLGLSNTWQKLVFLELRIWKITGIKVTSWAGVQSPMEPEEMSLSTARPWRPGLLLLLEHSSSDL